MIKELDSWTLCSPKETKNGFGYKYYSIWGKKEGGIFPLVILTKPKYMSDKDYEELISSMKIEILEK